MIFVILNLLNVITKMSRILSISILMIAFATMSFGQASEYSAKNEGWLVKIDEAYAQSQKSGKPILANFTGSDWCGWCKRLDKSVFHHQEFKDWAKKNVVLLELDYPRRFQVPADIKQQNADLQRAFGVRGFPTIWLFDLTKDAAGQFNVNALGKTGYTKTVAEFTGGMEQMMAKRSKT